jgi:putative spermidine/putrescine transport system permease protein
MSRLRRFPFWSWLWFVLGALYFLLPLLATFEFSLSWDPAIPFKAYQRAFEDKDFWETFMYSNVLALTTIFVSIILLQQHIGSDSFARARRFLVKFITLMPFVYLRSSLF